MHRSLPSFIGLALFFQLLLAGCTPQEQAEVLTAIAPPAQTAAAQGKYFAETQAANLVDSAQALLATEAAKFKQTAKARAATEIAELLDTAQAHLVTEAIKQVTLAPTTWMVLKSTAEAAFGTQAVLRLPQAQTQALVILKSAQVKLSTEAAVHGPQALTEVAAFNRTAEAVASQAPQNAAQIQTQQAGAESTSQALTVTQQVLLSTPSPSSTSREALPVIVTYTASHDESLSAIARRFSLSVDRLLQLNQARLPDLQLDPNRVQQGWTLILSVVPQEIFTPGVVPIQVPWSSTPGCDVSQVDWLLPPIACENFALEVVSNTGHSSGCLSLDNLSGTMQTFTRYEGWLLTDSRGVLSYGWYLDERDSIVLIGPAIIVQQSSRTACGK